MSTRNDSKDWKDQNAPAQRNLMQSIRKMAITLTNKALWQVLGHLLPNGQPETRDVDVFMGIGIYARPKGRPEAIVLFAGGAGNPVIVAARDEDTRKAVAASLGADETMLFNSQAVVYVKADGTVEVRAAGGAAAALATKADLARVVTYLQGQFDSITGHTHATPSGPTTLLSEGGLIPGTSADDASVEQPDGTSVLKGQ